MMLHLDTAALQMRRQRKCHRQDYVSVVRCISIDKQQFCQFIKCLNFKIIFFGVMKWMAFIATKCYDINSGGTTGVQTAHRTGAHGPRFHGSSQSQYNKQLLSANCLFLLMALLSLFSSHRKNWFAARCEYLHLIKKNSQRANRHCEFFLYQ